MSELHATITFNTRQGGAWLLRIWDDQGDVDECEAFTSGLAARRDAESEAGQRLDWTIKPGLHTADWSNE